MNKDLVREPFGVLTDSDRSKLGRVFRVIARLYTLYESFGAWTIEERNCITVPARTVNNPVVGCPEAAVAPKAKDLTRIDEKSAGQRWGLNPFFFGNTQLQAWYFGLRQEGDEVSIYVWRGIELVRFTLGCGIVGYP